MKEYAKLINNTLSYPPSFYKGIINYNLNEKALIEDGYKEVIRTDIPDTVINYELTYTEDETSITVSYKELPPPTPYEPTIDDYKRELQETDYKIIKCSEYQMNNMPLPYDIKALHEERQALRDKINELEVK